MEQRRYRVCVASDGGAHSDRVFEGNEYELKKRFPLDTFPKPISEHREENPRHNITFYFKLYSSIDGKSWKLDSVDPRLS